MFQSFKRYIVVFILVGLIGSLPTLANSVRTEKAKGAEVYSLDFQGDNNNILKRRSILSRTSHSYSLSLKQGQRIKFNLRSNRDVSINIKSPSGAVKQNHSQTEFKGVLEGDGDFIIEISAEDLSLYTLEINK